MDVGGFLAVWVAAHGVLFALVIGRRVLGQVIGV